MTARLQACIGWPDRKSPDREFRWPACRRNGPRIPDRVRLELPVLLAARLREVARIVLEDLLEELDRALAVGQLVARRDGRLAPQAAHLGRRPEGFPTYEGKHLIKLWETALLVSLFFLFLLLSHFQRNKAQYLLESGHIDRSHACKPQLADPNPIRPNEAPTQSLEGESKFRK